MTERVAERITDELLAEWEALARAAPTDVRLLAVIRELHVAREALRAAQRWVYEAGVKARIPHSDSPESAEWQALLVRIADALSPGT